MRGRPHHHRQVQKAHLAERLLRARRQGLAPDQLRDLGLGHHTNVSSIAAGEANATTLWQWMGGMLTWYRVAQTLDLGEPEMLEQLALGQRLCERYAATGRIAFEGEEHDLAKTGAGVMDELAHQVPRNVALAAADWGETRVNQIRAEMERSKG